MAHANTMDDGRETMFREVMERFSEIQNRYKGVRGELLAKVRAELESLAPGGAPVVNAPAPRAAPQTPPPATRAAKQTPPRAAPQTAAPAPRAATQTPPPAPKATPNAPPAPVVKVATSGMLPSCRSCGGTMREAGDGSLVCARGHVRQLAS